MFNSVDNFGKSALAIFYFIGGATICGINFICISAIPDCYATSAPRYFASLGALLFMSTVAILPTTFVVPFIIGIDKDIVIHQPTLQLCAFLIRFTLFSATLFYMIAVIQRTVEAYWQSLTGVLCSQKTIFICLVLIICLSFADAFTYTRSKNILRFDSTQFVWIKPEQMLVEDEIICIAFVTFMFLLYITAALQVLIEHFAENSQQEVRQNSLLHKLVWPMLYLFFDGVFVLLSAFMYVIPTHRNAVGVSALLGYIQSFGQPTWSAIAAFSCSAPLRKAIVQRLHMMLIGDRISERENRLRGRKLSKLTIKASASPVFQFFDKSSDAAGIIVPIRSYSCSRPTNDSNNASVFVLNMGT